MLILLISINIVLVILLIWDRNSIIINMGLLLSYIVMIIMFQYFGINGFSISRDSNFLIESLCSFYVLSSLIRFFIMMFDRERNRVITNLTTITHLMASMFISFV